MLSIIDAWLVANAVPGTHCIFLTKDKRIAWSDTFQSIGQKRDIRDNKILELTVELKAGSS